jgi:hypothetical protein
MLLDGLAMVDLIIEYPGGGILGLCFGFTCWSILFDSRENELEL